MNLNEKKNIERLKKRVAIVLTVVIFLFLNNSVYAEPGAGDIIESTMEALKTIVKLIGGGFAVWGVVNLIEGYGNDNRATRS